MISSGAAGDVAQVGIALLLFLVAGAPAEQAPKRARALGIVPGVLNPGPFNAITDVAGVAVGHVTLIEGDSIRTGVTAIVPHGGNLFQEKVPAGISVGNGFGKLAGYTQVAELGSLETPIILTNTLSVAEGVAGAVEHTLAQAGNEQVRSVNAVVGETNDGSLNDIRRRVVTRAHVLEAIRSARGGAVAEGAVGAGTGTVCFGFKGGIGTASRSLPPQLGGWTLGALVQTNYGGILTVDGAPVGRELGRYYLKDGAERSADGSCMIVVATDAPLDGRSLERVAARALQAMARTGASGSNGSGDYAIAFSTAPSARIAASRSSRVRTYETVATDALSPLFQAAIEATEEAIYNSMTMARTMTGAAGRRVEALPLDRLEEICRRHGVLRGGR